MSNSYQYKAIIIDDEAKARRIIEVILAENCPELAVVDTCPDVPAAVKSIKKHNPDIVFLDIEMPGYSGFALLEHFEKPDFEVIFTTAYSEHALRAFQVSAVDYLLKPIQIDQMVAAVNKAIRLIGKSQTEERLTALRENMQDNALKKIGLPMAQGLRFVALRDIVYLKADGSYTNVFLTDGTKVLISRKIKHFENMLAQESIFFRTHRSFIINVIHIKEYIRQDGGSVLMENGDSVQIARDRRDEFQGIINAQHI